MVVGQRGGAHKNVSLLCGNITGRIMRTARGQMGIGLDVVVFKMASLRVPFWVLDLFPEERWNKNK